MPVKRRILPLAISALLLIPTAQAASKWDCRASSDGGWECLQDGVPVTPQTITAPEPVVSAPVEQTEQTQTPNQPASQEATPRESATQALEEPKTVEVTPVVAEETKSAVDDASIADERQEAPPSEPPTDTAPRLTEQPSVESEAIAAEPEPAVTELIATPEASQQTLPATITAIEDRPDLQETPAREKTTEPSTATDTMQEQPEPVAAEQTKEPETAQQAAPTPATISAANDAAVSKEETIREKTEDTLQTQQAVTHTAPFNSNRIDLGLDWNQCGVRHPSTPRQGTQTIDDTTHIEADAADLYRTENRADFAGNVKLERGDEKLEADFVTYHREESTLDAEGNVYLEQPGLRMTSNKMHYNLDKQQGNAEQAEYRLADPVARGNAMTVEILNSDQSYYTDVNYTTCQPGNNDWLIEAEELEIDQATGVGVAHNAKLRFKGVPFIYLPYASFPIDDRRKSGFLPPSIGTSENTGADISIPYYFNIAPQMDATFTPRIMSNRGLLLGGEFRYLAEKNQGVITAELLPSDSDQGPGENKTRGALNAQLEGTPAPRWRYDIDLNYVSDNDYIDDLGNSLAATSVKHQERRGDIHYQGSDWSFLGRLQHFQTIDRSIAINGRPYSRLPQLQVNLERPDQALGLTYHLHSEYVDFDHSSSTKVKGQRIDLQPGISLPVRRPWGFLTPKLSLRHTSYSLENQTLGKSDSPSRTLPTLSLDGGLYFERSTSWFGNSVTQTLEPRVFYLYTPKEDQSDIPDFDTANLGFSFANLFRENRFSGADKVGDANQLTTALTSRNLSTETGEELFRASIGQISYFRDRDVQLISSGAVVNDDSSSIVAEVAAKLSRNWRMQAGMQWNPHTDNGTTEASAFGLHYLDEKQRILNLTYRYTDGSIEQTDLSARWPISHQLHAVGRWNYSLLHGKTMESFAGIEYDSCCWISRFVVRDYRSDANAEGNLALFLQLELKGLTSLGDKIDQFLERGILGYRTEN